MPEATTPVWQWPKRQPSANPSSQNQSSQTVICKCCSGPVEGVPGTFCARCRLGFCSCSRKAAFSAAPPPDERKPSPRQKERAKEHRTEVALSGEAFAAGRPRRLCRNCHHPLMPDTLADNELYPGSKGQNLCPTCWREEQGVGKWDYISPKFKERAVFFLMIPFVIALAALFASSIPDVLPRAKDLGVLLTGLIPWVALLVLGIIARDLVSGLLHGYRLKFEELAPKIAIAVVALAVLIVFAPFAPSGSSPFSPVRLGPAKPPGSAPAPSPSKSSLVFTPSGEFIGCAAYPGATPVRPGSVSWCPAPADANGWPEKVDVQPTGEQRYPTPTPVAAPEPAAKKKVAKLAAPAGTPEVSWPPCPHQPPYPTICK